MTPESPVVKSRAEKLDDSAKELHGLMTEVSQRPSRSFAAAQLSTTAEELRARAATEKMPEAKHDVFKDGLL